MSLASLIVTLTLLTKLLTEDRNFHGPPPGIRKVENRKWSCKKGELLENSKHDKWKHMEVLSRGQSRLPHWLLHFCVPRVQFLNSWNLQNVCIMAYWLILTGWRNIIDSRLSPTLTLSSYLTHNCEPPSPHLFTSLYISPHLSTTAPGLPPLSLL